MSAPAPEPAPSQRDAVKAAGERLTDARFQALAYEVLGAIEATLDRWLQDDVIDIDSQRTGGLLELVMPSGGKVVVNTQPPLHELWLAARTGGFHFRWADGRWIDREGAEFFAVLSRELSAQAGRDLRVPAARER
ncbi:MAG: iron donor protein CyaY [Ideonella sp.]|nr:iron donor protein CyaY [Ideonella sp.]MCC7456265.1 iron donor protein CyaY [Nitrospira sp.]